MEKRYRALRTISVIYKVLGGLLLLLTVLGVIAFCVMAVGGGAAARGIGRELGLNSGIVRGMAGGLMGGVIGGIGLLIYGGLASVSLFAFGQLIDLLISMEESTRYTYYLMHQQTNRPASPPAPREMPPASPPPAEPLG